MAGVRAIVGETTASASSSNIIKPCVYSEEQDSPTLEHPLAFWEGRPVDSCRSLLHASYDLSLLRSLMSSSLRTTSGMYLYLSSLICIYRASDHFSTAQHAKTFSYSHWQGPQPARVTRTDS